MNIKSSPKINIKLIQGLSILSQKEFNEFVSFSTSRYFSGQRSYTNILKILKGFHKTDFRDHSNKSILDFLMKDLKLGKNTLQNRLSELYKIFEMFIVIRELKFLPFERNKTLMNYYSGKNSFRLFDYVYYSSRELLKKEKISTHRIRSEFLLYDLSSTKFFMQRNSRSFTEHYSLRCEFHIYEFLVDMLKNCIELQQQKFMGTKQGTILPETTLKSLPVNDILEKIRLTEPAYFDLIRIIHNMYLSFEDYSDDNHFKNAVRIHKKLKASLSEEDNQYIYLLFITYCINQTHFNKPLFYKQLFNIIRQKLNDGYFAELTEYNFPVNNFRDYVFIGLRVGETEWVKYFIKNYSQYLPPEFRKDDVLIAQGMVSIKENKFEEALLLLNKVRKKNYLHYTDSSFHKLFAFYELNNYVDALVEIERIKKYFKSNKNIPAIFLKKYIHYLKDIEVLFKFSEGKFDRNDFNLHFKNPGKISGDNWVGRTVKKILKE